MQKKLHIHGMGIATAIGHNLESTWTSIREGISGIRYFDNLIYKNNKIHIGRTDPLIIKNYLDEYDQKINQSELPQVALALYTTLQAIHDAQKEDNFTLDPNKTGIYVGTSTASLNSIQQNTSIYNEGRRPPILSILHGMNNFVSTEIARRLKITGPNITISSACASALQALQIAIYELNAGKINKAIVTGVDSSINKSTIESWANMRILSKISDASTAARPFCKTRNGMVFAEGSGTLIISLNKSNYDLEILSQHNELDTVHSLDQSELSMISCMKKALKQSNLSTSKIDFIHANASGSIISDFKEASAINKTFGNSTPVFASKGLYGNTLGAGGIISIIINQLIQKNNLIPTNSNIENKDEIISKLINCYYNKPIVPVSSYSLINSFGFGGTNHVIVLSSKRSTS